MDSVNTVTRYTVKRDVVARGVADEMILLDLETGTYFTLNAVGAAIWQQLENGNERDAAIAAVIEQFEVDLATATEDFDEYINALSNEGLLVG